MSKKKKEIEPWDIFWERYKEDFSTEYRLKEKIIKRIKEIWHKTNPHIGWKDKFAYHIDKHEEIAGTKLFYVSLGAIAGVIIDEIKKEEEKLTREVINAIQRALPDIRITRICPFCGEENEWNAEKCEYCGRKLIGEKDERKN